MWTFWYFDVSIWSGEENFCLSGFCQNNVIASYCRDWEPRYPTNTSKRLQCPWITVLYPQLPPRNRPDTPQTSPGKSKSQQTTTDANRHCQTYSNSTGQCHGVSATVCLCLLAPVVVFWHHVFIGHAWGVSGGCLGRYLGCLSGIRGNWRRLDVFG